MIYNNIWWKLFKHLINYVILVNEGCLEDGKTCKYQSKSSNVQFDKHVGATPFNLSYDNLEGQLNIDKIYQWQRCKHEYVYFVSMADQFMIKL